MEERLPAGNLFFACLLRGGVGCEAVNHYLDQEPLALYHRKIISKSLIFKDTRI